MNMWSSVLVFHLMCAHVVVRGFNFATNLPITKQGPNAKAYFGYSVALHQETDAATDRVLQSW